MSLTSKTTLLINPFCPYLFSLSLWGKLQYCVNHLSHFLLPPAIQNIFESFILLQQGAVLFQTPYTSSENTFTSDGSSLTANSVTGETSAYIEKKSCNKTFTMGDQSPPHSALQWLFFMTTSAAHITRITALRAAAVQQGAAIDTPICPWLSCICWNCMMG